MRIGRLQHYQLLGLAQRGIVFEALAQHLGIIEPGVEIVRTELLALGKDQFGVLVFAQPGPQFGQQPHRHRLIGNLEQERANPAFGQVVILIIVGGERAQHFGRVAFDIRQLALQFRGPRRIGLLVMRYQQLDRCG